MMSGVRQAVRGGEREGVIRAGGEGRGKEERGGREGGG